MTPLTGEQLAAMFRAAREEPDPAPVPSPAPTDKAAADFQARLHREEQERDAERWAAIEASRESRPAPAPATPEGMVDVSEAARRAGWHGEPVWIDWAAAGWLAEVVDAADGELTMSAALEYVLGVALARAAAAGGWTGAFFATDNAKRPRADGQSWRFVVTTGRLAFDVRTPEGGTFRGSFTGNICLNPLRAEIRLDESEATL